MDGLALVEQAQTAGLKLSVINGKLVMKGPRRLEPLAKLLTDNKEVVIAVLLGSRPPSPIADDNVYSVGVTETPPVAENVPGFADSLLAKRKAGQNRQPALSPPPAEIIAVPVVLCPRCHRVPVLRELRQMTGGLCYPCWEAEARS